MIQVSSDKQRLQQENQEVNRRFNEVKLAIETSGLDKNKLAGQIKDLQGNLDALTRAKHSADSTIKNLEQQLKAVSIEFEEQRSLRIGM